MKKNWQFIARVIFTSVAVFAALSYIETCYLYALMCATGIADSKNLPYVSAPGLCPYLIFILVTPRLSWNRRCVAIIAGMVAFLALDLVMTWVWVPYFQTSRPSLRNMGSHYGYYVVAYYLFPFLIWFAFAFRQIESFFRGTSESGVSR